MIINRTSRLLLYLRVLFAARMLPTVTSHKLLHWRLLLARRGDLPSIRSVFSLKFTNIEVLFRHGCTIV